MSEQRGVTKACEELERRLIMTPILVILNNSAGMKVYSDTSCQELGCVLIQNGKVIKFRSCR